jgi:hypothetical protein
MFSMTTSAASKSVESWFETFPREEAERRIRELEEELSKLKSALALMGSSNGERAMPIKPRKSRAVYIGGTPPTKPAKILTIMREHPGREWRPTQIHAEMVRRDWLPESQTHRKRFYATLSRMADDDDGRLIRPRKGIYRLAPEYGGAPI